MCVYTPCEVLHNIVKLIIIIGKKVLLVALLEYSVIQLIFTSKLPLL